MNGKQNDKFIRMIILISVTLAVLVVAGTLWMGQSASKANDEAVHSVSRFYMDELTSRREQVVETNLNSNIDNMNKAVELMDEEDLHNLSQMRAYQKKMKELFNLDKFAFVDREGLIYTAEGLRRNISDYGFNYLSVNKPKVAVVEEEGAKKVIIAQRVKGKKIKGKELRICFIEKDMNDMLKGFSMNSDESEVTFCNIYRRNGVALTDMVLGGLAKEDNLLEAMEHAEYEDGYTYEKLENDFTHGQAGITTFTYNGIRETLDFVPVKGTDWMLTYLIRESVISEQISGISDGIARRSMIQTLLIALVMLILFIFMMSQLRRNSKLEIERERIETESKVRQDELEHRLSIQRELLEQEKKRAEQDKMITAMASDYRSVYYVDLDDNEGICYRHDPEIRDVGDDGKPFAFHEEFVDYANKYVAESYREEFLEFIDPDRIRESLATETIIAHRYLTVRDGEESYEMLRMAGVRHPKDRDDHIVHAIGVGFTNVDSEMREDMMKNQTLSDALSMAEDANKAKTQFLSNMSHEIRTPMNAIIGLDTIALADPELSDKTRDYLNKIDHSAHHLLKLINDILDVSRIESGRMTVKNEEFSFPLLMEQINTMISGQCRESGLTYECRVDEGLNDYYIGDDMKLKQVIINILGNAVKYTPEGGTVTFTVDKMAAFEGKTTLKFTMKDTGIGMSKEFLPKIFETFSQEDADKANKYGSTGLGMAIAKSMVEMMGGTIDVESEKGKGTTFTLAVTLTDSNRQAAEEEKEVFNPQELSVLVIDDDSVASEHARIVLESVGITSDIASSGAEAVDMVRVREARQEPYNLILVDWKMPDMDGLETTRAIRKIAGTDSAVIILTAYNWDDILDEALEAGVDSFITKPLFASNVIEKFRTALNKRGIMKAGAGKADLKGRRVLLAEDMMVNAEIMKELLKMREMEVEHAENGKIAVDMFEKSPAGYYDAVLMDMKMPEMNGLDATKAIRALDRDDAKTIPIIALTANAFDEDVRQSLQAGLDAHLSKPVDPVTLFATLENLIKA